MSRKLRPLARESDTAPFHINFKMFKCLYRYRELELHMLVLKTMITMMMTTTTVLLIRLTTTKSFRRIVRAWTANSARAMLSNPLYRRCLALWRHSAANWTTSSTQSVDTLMFSSSLRSSMIKNRPLCRKRHAEFLKTSPVVVSLSLSVCFSCMFFYLLVCLMGLVA